MADPMAHDLENLAASLTEAELQALLAFPAIQPANPVRFQAAVTFGSLWRKLAKHRDAFEQLHRLGIVERRVSRGETLWRPTRQLGLAVYARLAPSKLEG